MQQLWHESNWRLDQNALVLPNGQRLALSSIRDWQGRLLVGEFDLTGKWSGWRVRQQFLIPPGGTMRRGRIAERTRRHLAQAQAWSEQDVGRRQLRLF